MRVAQILNRPAPGLVVGLAAAVLAILLADRVAWIGNLELRALDFANLAARRIDADPRILVIGIEADTFGTLGAVGGRLDRRRHAELIQGLNEADAASIGFDLMFTELGDPDEDYALEHALADSRVPVTAVLEEGAFSRDSSAPAGVRMYFRDIAVPVDIAPKFGLSHALPFAPDGTVRGFYAVMEDWSFEPRRALPHLALASYAALAGEQREVRLSDGTLTVGGREWKVGPDYELIVSWLGPEQDFERIEYAEALEALRSAEGRERFRGKAVLVGRTDGADEANTPVGRIPGVWFVANALNSLLAGRPLTRLPVEAGWLWSLAIACGVGVLVAPLRRGRALLGVLGVLAGGLAVSFGLLAWADVWLAGSTPFLAGLLAAGLGTAYSAASSSKLVERFVPAFIRKGRREDVPEKAAVLFVDVRGSTSLVAAIGPADGRELLSRSVRCLTDAAKQAGAEVERTQGDGLVAVFRENEHADYATRAIRCVEEMQRCIEPVSDWLTTQHGKPVRLWFGLEAGTITGRVLESQGRDEWSIYGLDVHLAARLQAECSSQKVAVLIGPKLARLVEPELPLEPMQSFLPKGFAEPVQPYTFDNVEHPRGERLTL